MGLIASYNSAGWLMAGDDLTIILFLVGAAISFAVASTSQARWKHPLLIQCRRAAWRVLSGIFAIAGLGWPLIKPISSRGTAAVVQIATSPVAWFAVLMLGLAAALSRRKEGDKQSEIKEPEKRIFIDVSPGYLIDLYNEVTKAQGDVLLSGYVDKWIRVTGRLRGLSSIHAAHVILAQMLDSDGRCISAIFSEEWESKLADLISDTEIIVIGQIYAGDKLRVSLMNCELI
jgi:MYXO-CTERM domain-containing protein